MAGWQGVSVRRPVALAVFIAATQVLTSTGVVEFWTYGEIAMQNGQVTSTRSAMSGLLPLRVTDPREVGGYGLLGRIGEGGQGVVFLAVSSAGTRVALKVLPATTDSQVRSRFLKEVAAAQRVARFCTAQVLDAGIFERRPFIVNEYVNGPSLVEVVEQDGPRSGSALERLAIATLTALGAVHAAGMVHRDFKPGNVLLGPDGPVVIDFGLATVPGMTTTGLSGQVAVGTPAYMAPEQLAGKRVTAAADMWSWAVSMTFAGTGKLPFTGESLTAMAFAILHGEPSVGRLPEPLGSLVRHCLSKDPAARPSARDALSELVAAGAQPMGPLPPQAVSVAADDEASSSSAAPVEAPEPPERIAGASPKHGRVGDKPEHAPGSSGRIRWRWRATALLASVLIIGSAGGLILILSLHGPLPERSAGGHAVSGQEQAAKAAARTRAVTWILQQVSQATVVSCDSQMCAELARRGFPSLDPLGPASTDPLGSVLVVATAAVRAQFGKRLTSVYAPAVIASFGSGNAKIEIRWVYPGGTAAYRAALQPDLRARKANDAQLLGNGHIKVSATARAQLLSGEIDPRLPMLIAAMAAAYPVRIVDFGGQPPGGGPASLLRSMDLATHVSAAHLAAPAYTSWMRSLVHAQRAQYLPALSQLVTLPAGKAVLRIEFGVPSPLG
jgi:serine/threonine protein kinase